PLQPIGEDIHFFQLPKPPENNEPALITLCTWLGGATPPRIQKYISGYRALYSSSAILLITTRILEISALPFSVLHARLAPAREVVRRVVASSSSSSSSRSSNNYDDNNHQSVLLHIFSHGGCNTAIQLALSLQQEDPRLELGRYLGGIIFDCCPGDTSFGRAYQAAAHSLAPRSLLAQTLGRALLYPVIGVITGLQQTGWMSSVRGLRAQLNDPAVFGKTAPRLYLYSTADAIVRWEDVESHQREAEVELEECCTVKRVAFPDSPHCALVRDHHDCYWTEIERFW
ncbi:TMEM53 family protein, partial [Aspergillus saccharolyticus JOP 1030-1]